MRRATILPTVLASLLSAPLLNGHGQEFKKGEPPKKEGRQESSKVRELMRRKLETSQGVLEAIALKDFDRVEKNAQVLIDLSRTSEWRVIQTPRYLQHSTEFQEAAERLAKNARAKNLEGTVLSYVGMTLSCVHCHEYIRETRSVRREPERSRAEEGALRN
jgi:hypothetical protein